MSASAERGTGKLISQVKKVKLKHRFPWSDSPRIGWDILRKKDMLVKSSIKNLRPNSIDFTVTSPPYLTDRKYIRTNCLELLGLGFAENEILYLEKDIRGSKQT